MQKRMNLIEIHEVSAEDISPNFGRCYFRTGQIMINKDLSPRAKSFVVFHELVHSQHMYKKGVFFELYANWVAFMAEPLGGISVIFKTITSVDRIKYYIKLIRGKL